MGLDMYLKKKIYIGAEYEHRNVKSNIKISIGGENIPINAKHINEIVEDIYYWRKSNAIHKWFVDNCQGGVDDCREYMVSVEQLKNLVVLLTKVLKVKGKDPSLQRLVIQKYLPMKAGFFFGSTEIDEYYFIDTEETLKALQKEIKKFDLLSDNKKSNISYCYQSSW